MPSAHLYRYIISDRNAKKGKPKKMGLPKNFPYFSDNTPPVPIQVGFLSLIQPVSTNAVPDIHSSA